MFKHIQSVTNSWIINRASVNFAYYVRRLNLPFKWNVEAQIQTPFGMLVRVPLVDSDANRQTCATFSSGNAWNRFTPKGEVNTIVDLGANRGHTSLYWKTRFPKAEIHCIEMDFSNCQACHSLLKINHLTGHVAQVAICEKDAPLRYRTHAANTRHRLESLANSDHAYQYEDSYIDVDGLTFESFLASRQIDHVDLMKVDIEGAEQYLLNTVDQWAPRVSNLILEVHHNIDVPNAKKVLEQAGFEVQIGDESNRMEWWCVQK